MDAMTSHDIAALETQVDALDQETAERVTRLVFECNASVSLAILAVQDANRTVYEQGKQSSSRHKAAGVLAALRAR
jgi:hypothetical protein